jgi:predicted  nucleic acid-binding Zn-ribbon protein
LEDKLKLIVKLQKLDSEMDEIIGKRQGLPDEITSLEEETADITQRIESKKEKAADDKLLKAKLKTSVKESAEKVKKYKEQQTTARNNKEYNALTKEIESEESETAKSEAEIKKIEDAESKVKEQIDDLEKQLAELEPELKTKKKELEKIIKETQAEEQALANQIKSLRIEVEKGAKDILRRYDKQRTGKFKNIVVMMRNGACTGCNSSLPPQRRVQVNENRNFIVCENCGRIVVSEKLFKENEVAV